MKTSIKYDPKFNYLIQRRKLKPETIRTIYQRNRAIQ